MHLSTCWKGEKMFASRCTGSFPRLPTCNWQWRMTVQEEEDEEGEEEPWLWLLLWVLWSVAAYAITFHSSNKVDNKQKCSQKRRKTSSSLPATRPSPEKPNAKCSWNDEMQGRHSTNFEHQVSLWFFFSFLVFFFYIFSDYFFPVCFLSLHNKSLRKAFQFKWMKKKANVLCMQPTAAAAARAGWLTHRGREREEGERYGKQSKQSVNDALKWSRKGSWLLDFHDSLEHSKSLGNWSNK